MMPGMNGFEVLRRIRGAANRAAHIPVLMLTARAISLHHGTVTARNAPGGGFIVEINLPVV
jgi:CheY-like chemotaxis protein